MEALKQGVPIIFPKNLFKEKYLDIAMTKLFSNIVTNKNDCWEWTGIVYPNGTTCVGIGPIKMSAKRLSYLSFKGEIEKGLTVRSTCRNNLCINPDHLFLASMGVKYKDLDNAKNKIR